MIAHVGIEAGDHAASRAFYEAALEPLGIGAMMEFEGVGTGFGKEAPFFWVGERGRPAVRGVHVAFGARTTEQVDAFHAAALAAGGTDNGAPGPRPQYRSDYYGAFVLDPDGNNIEAVCLTGASG
jgi:catechol 2,3-dioxygenase-like lactoylglutathione lyase family enzyme